MPTLKTLTIICIGLGLTFSLGACGSKDKDSYRGGQSSADGEGDKPRDRRPVGELPEGKEDPGTGDPKDQGGDETTPDQKEDEQKEIPLVDLKTSIGVRNYDQINYTLSYLTGVPTTNANVVAEFVALKTQLPDSNNIKAVTPAKVSGLTKLAAQYCNEATLDPTLRAQILPGFDFAAAPATAFADPDAVAKALIDKFWGTGLESLADQQGDIDIVATLIEEIRTGNPAATTQFIAMGACAAVLSSAPVFLL